MKFNGVHIDEERFNGLVRSSDTGSDQRLSDMRKLWWWRLRLSRQNLTEAEHDIEVVANYAEHVHLATSYDWDSEEGVGHVAFLETNSAQVPRLERMLIEIGCAPVIETLRAAAATKEPKRLRELDLQADAALPRPETLADRLLAYALKNADTILVPERASPPAPTPVAPRPVVKANATWESVHGQAPADPPAYSPAALFDPGSWLTHPSFGVGYVAEAREGKLRVLFATGERRLAGRRR